MKTTTHNGFTLPLIGCDVNSGTEKQKKEFLRLLSKAHGNWYFYGEYNYYGVSESKHRINWCWDSKASASIYLTLVPIPEAITWLKIALGEKTDAKDWNDDMHSTFPMINTKTEQQTPKRGDMVEVSEDGVNWHIRDLYFTGGISKEGNFIVQS